MDQTRIEQAAAFIDDETRRGATFRNIPGEFKPRDLAEAYAVQKALARLRSGGREPEIVGYKLAHVSRAIQELVGMDQPVYGTVLPGTIHHSPHQARVADYNHFGLECETALRLGADLSPDDAPFTRESVAPAVAACYPAFELVDDRAAEFSQSDILSLIADNAWYGGMVLGPEVTDWQSRDLGNLRGEFIFNGETVGEASTGDALGHPLEGLAWLANNVTVRDGPMRAGMTVITGSILADRAVVPGDRAAFVVEKLGRVEMSAV